MVLLKGIFTANQLLYDVTDPIHPRLLCDVANTSAHLFTGDAIEWLKPVSANQTNVVLHSLASGNESVAGSFPFEASSGSWVADRSVIAYTAQVPPDDTNFPAGGVAVYLYAHGQTGHLFTYPIPQIDCVCRFGLPQQVLAVSPDGQYLVAGWVVRKGSQPLAVYRVSDRTMVTFLDPSVMWAYWDRSGHRLFLDRFGADATESFTPETGVSPLIGGGAWTYLPGFSPDGKELAFTAYPDPNQTTQPRVYVHELTDVSTTRLLIDKPRTQVLFVKDGWVWYLEEAPCDPATCGAPWGTQPTGKVFAMQLSSGIETEVMFGIGENPVAQPGGVNWLSFGPGEFWPAT